MTTRHVAPLLRREVWMRIKDHKKLASIVIVQEKTQREVSEFVGWKSHSYLNRILRGEIKTITTDKAALLAKCLGMPMDDLFLTELSTFASSQQPSKKTTGSTKVPA